jgi:transposase
MLAAHDFDQAYLGHTSRRQLAEDALWSAAQEQLNEDPKSGAAFAFINKERTRLKLFVLGWHGVWVLAKRLEQGQENAQSP